MTAKKRRSRPKDDPKYAACEATVSLNSAGICPVRPAHNEPHPKVRRRVGLHKTPTCQEAPPKWNEARESKERREFGAPPSDTNPRAHIPKCTHVEKTT